MVITSKILQMDWYLEDFYIWLHCKLIRFYYLRPTKVAINRH